MMMWLSWGTYAMPTIPTWSYSYITITSPAALKIPTCFDKKVHHV